MSKEQSSFIKALWTVAAVLASTLIIGMAGSYVASGNADLKMSENIKANKVTQEVAIKNVKKDHNKDMKFVWKDLKEIKLTQKEAAETDQKIIRLLLEIKNK
jgi:hypothetical protein